MSWSTSVRQFNKIIIGTADKNETRLAAWLNRCYLAYRLTLSPDKRDLISRGRKILESMLTDVVSEALKIPGDALEGKVMAIDDPDLRLYVQQHAARRIKDIDATTEERVRELWLEAEAAGEGWKGFQKRLTEELGFSQNRAKTIARTETHTALVHTMYSRAEKAGFTHKRWMSVLDERTRYAHGEAHGQTVTLDRAFTVGGELLKYPGDPDGSAGNVVNCRCFVVFETKESEEQPGNSDQDLGTTVGRGWLTGEHPKAAEITPEEAGLIAAYTGNLYTLINSYLRFGVNDEFSRDSLDFHMGRFGGNAANLFGTEEIKASTLARKLEDVVKKYSVKLPPSRIYRKISSDLFRDLKIGDIIFDKGFVSTSWEAWDDSNLEIIAKKEYEALPVTMKVGGEYLSESGTIENEVLLSPGAVFKVLDVSDGKVTLEYLGSGASTKSQNKSRNLDKFTWDRDDVIVISRA